MGIQNWSEKIILVNLAEEPQMSEELRTVTEIAADRGDSDVVIDFSGVDIVTSSSLAKVLKLRKVLNDRGRRLVLCGLKPQTRGIFQVTGLDNVFDFIDDQFIALAGLQMAN